MKRRLWDILLGVDFHILERDGYQRQVRGEDTVILAHLHCLPSTIELFNMLLRDDLSIPGKQIVLIPKSYSTIESAENNLNKLGIAILSEKAPFKPGYYDSSASSLLKSGCQRAFSICNEVIKRGRKPRLVLVDDGGMLTETWWKNFETGEFEVVSVQQTASGTRREPRPSEVAKIDVARSAAKRHFESKIISAGVLKKISDLDVLKGSERVGIAGMGALGAALAEDLSRREKWVHLYDVKQDYHRPKRSARYSKIGVFLNNCDLVFGCTGRNFIKVEHLRKIKPDHSIHFVSCSSRDTEFLDLLRFGKIKPETVGEGFGRLEVSFEGRPPHIVENGGFPINFDRSVEQESPEEIVLTRALVLAAIFQALCVKVKEKRENALMLSPSMQQSLVSQWLEQTGKNCSDFGVDGGIGSLNWWKGHSFGDVPQLKIAFYVLAGGASKVIKAAR
jgi:hypothetical protein